MTHSKLGLLVLTNENISQKPLIAKGNESPLGLESSLPTEEDFTNQMQVWQKRLRLSDWEVQLRVCRLNEMPSPDCVGAIIMYGERKVAVLKMLAPNDIPLLDDSFIDKEPYNYDMTIVHELLHLHFFPFQVDDETPAGMAQEQAINCISRALVQACASPIVQPPMGE